VNEVPRARPKGTQDFVPPDSGRLLHVENVFRHLAELHGYQEIVTPTFEHTEVFVKSSGEGSDIVTKEMYSFRDRGERALTLRPEGTPGVVRAVLENRLRLPCRLYYAGPYFRYCRPQKGRTREFHQVGVEALGESSPLVDAEIIYFGARFFQSLDIGDCKIQVNSIGCRVCRPAHREKLVAFLEEQKDRLCDDCRVRIERNPLRVFDCKVETCRAAVAAAPAPRQYLCQDCERHHEQVLAVLKRRRLSFETNDRLVRGLDYYNRTTFEYISASLGAQDSLGGGGRYDYLFEEFGGPALPAVGVAIGLERTLLAAPAVAAPERRNIVFVVWLTEAELEAAEDLADRLRSAGVPAQIDYDSGKLKGQFKSADAARATACVIVGPDELKKGVYSLKDLATGEQREVRSDQVVEAVRTLFGD
jgi:histidyl-tRNA synthetase